MPENPREVMVWDPFVRIFHWTLVICISVMFATGENVKSVHFPLGYFIVCLLFARIVWGFVGTRHARFSDFIYPPKTVLKYLADMKNRTPKHYIGHNPAGGMMVVFLLFFISFTAFAGLKALAATGRGPLADAGSAIVSIARADEDAHDHDQSGMQGKADHPDYGVWGTIHELLKSVVMILVILHICGVAVSSWLHRENLIQAMITGRKKIQ